MFRTLITSERRDVNRNLDMYRCVFIFFSFSTTTNVKSDSSLGGNCSLSFCVKSEGSLSTGNNTGHSLSSDPDKPVMDSASTVVGEELFFHKRFESK